MTALERYDLLSSYRMMVKIRRVEESLMEVFTAGEIPGFIHVCVGQEAAPVAICRYLKDTDFVASTHRGHGHAIAKGIPLDLFMAELFGKRNGPCMGRSGSMHLAFRPLGILGANGIVGGGIPIATGAALASSYKKRDDVVVCFFGEGATDEGVFHESLNIASLWKLPIVYVCENNQWAEFTPQRLHMPLENVASRASAYGMPGITVRNEFISICGAAAEAIGRARSGMGPTLLEIKSRRWHGHFVGDAQKYRPTEDIREAVSEDCIASLEAELLKMGYLTREDTETIDREIRQEVKNAIEFARKSPLPESSELMEGLYV